MGDVGSAGTAFSSLGNQSDKPRVRAEPDEPKAPLTFIVDAEKFSHGLSALDYHAVRIVHDAVTDRVSHNSYIVAIDGKCSMRERHGLNTEVSP